MERESPLAVVGNLAMVLEQLSPEDRTALSADVGCLLDKWKHAGNAKDDRTILSSTVKHKKRKTIMSHGEAPSDCLFLSLPLPVMKNILCLLQAKDIMRLCSTAKSFCYAHPSAIESALCTSAVALGVPAPTLLSPVNNYLSALSRCTCRLNKVETLLLQGRLVPGKYTVKVQDVESETGTVEFTMMGEIELLPDGSIEGSFSWDGEASKVYRGVWSPEILCFETKIGHFPYVYTVLMESVTKGGSPAGVVVAYLEGSFFSRSDTVECGRTRMFLEW